MTGCPDPSTFDPPAGFLRVVETLERAGFEAWAVGGALRDACEVRRPGAPTGGRSDWDVATAARPDAVMRLFRRTVPIGVEHGTVGVLDEDGSTYEVTTFRRDIETDGRHAVVTYADRIDDDLARRDFTINSLAWRPATSEMRDPFDGLKDLEHGVLRAVGEARDRFEEDYLRILRGLRFAGRFDLELEPDTKAALEASVDGLSRLSAERVRGELMKVLADPVPSRALGLYAECGALRHWFPELEEAAGDRAAWCEHLATVDAIRRHRPLVRLARLLLAVHGDPSDVPMAAASVLERLKSSTADRRRVVALVEGYLPFVSPTDSSAELRSWLAEVGPDWRDLFRLHAGETRAAADDFPERHLVAAWRLVHSTVLEHPPLTLSDLEIGGDDVLGLGVSPGPMVGLLLEKLLDQVLEDPERNERGALIVEATRLLEIAGLVGSGPSTGSGGDHE